MTTPTSAARGGPNDALAPLIEERVLLKQWLSRLDDCAGSVPYHIAVRVRSDYTERLGRVLDKLRPHRDELRNELDALRDALGDAESELTQAADRLEESRLRHLTGELELQAWSEQAPVLEEASAAAEAECARIRAELEQLRDMVREIDPAAAFAGDASLPAAAGETADFTPDSRTPEPFFGGAEQTQPRLSADEVFAEWTPSGAAAAEVADDEEDLPWLELLDVEPESAPAAAADDFDGLDFLERLSAETEEPTASAAAAEDDDFAFLQELDRALAASTTKPAARTDSSPTELLPCASCGGSNEPTAWYCEKCGEELA